jgi:hypothetical protein
VEEGAEGRKEGEGSRETRGGKMGEEGRSMEGRKEVNHVKEGRKEGRKDGRTDGRKNTFEG